MTTWLGKDNRRRDDVKKWEVYTDEEKIAQRDLGDYASFWRYTL
jgi:hypothetical protein